MLALDMDAGDFWAGQDGTWYNGGDPGSHQNPVATGLGGSIYSGVTFYPNSTNAFTANFGASPFKYAPPSPPGSRAGSEPRLETGHLLVPTKARAGCPVGPRHPQIFVPEFPRAACPSGRRRTLAAEPPDSPGSQTSPGRPRRQPPEQEGPPDERARGSTQPLPWPRRPPRGRPRGSGRRLRRSNPRPAVRAPARRGRPSPPAARRSRCGGRRVARGPRRGGPGSPGASCRLLAIAASTRALDRSMASGVSCSLLYCSSTRYRSFQT